MPQTVLLRAQGPSLAAFGVSGTLADTVVELYQGQTVIGSNDNWRDTQQQSITATGLAPTSDMESAILATLPPGAYTMIVRGKNGATGVGIVESFLVD